MVRFLKAGIVTTLFVFLFVAGLFPSPAQVLAAPAAVVTVSSAEGNAGETMGITVSLQGFSSLTGVENISGGQFELVYDPEQATVVSIKKGSLLGSDALFMPNQNYSENSIKVAWAYTSGGTSGDGDICNITFTLHKESILNPVIKNLVLYDQEVRPLVVDAQPAGANDSSGNSVALYPPETDTPPDSGGEQGDSVEPDQGNADSLTKPLEDGSTTIENNTSPGENSHGANRSWSLPSLIILVVLIITGVGLIFYWRIKIGRSR